MDKSKTILTVRKLTYNIECAVTESKFITGEKQLPEETIKNAEQLLELLKELK